MPVFIEELEFVPENVTASTYTDYLKGNIFQKINLRIQCRSEWWLIPTSSEGLLFGDSSFKTSDWISFPTNLYGFKDLNVDDTVIFNDGGTSPNNNTYIISEKINDYQIRVTDNVGAAVTLTNQLETKGRLDLIQDPKGFTLDFGLIENSDPINYDSKVDQSLMRYEIGVDSGTLPAFASPMLPVGKKDWQLGSCSFENITTGGERDNYTYKFEINQVLYIHPFYLPEQLLDITNEFPIAPKYFKKEKCLKYVARLRAYRELQDPNVYQEGVVDDQIGQTGWFDEEFNGGTPAYNANNFGYGNSIGALDPRKTTTFSFDIDTDTALATSPVRWVTMNFIVLPEKDNDIKNRNDLQQENYAWDRAQVDGGAVFPQNTNGEQFGTGWQVFQNVSVLQGTNQATVTGEVSFGSDAIDKINSLSNGGYLIAAYTSLGDVETADSYQAVTLLLDVNEMETEVTDDIVDVSTAFLYHDQNDNSIVTGGTTVKVEDEIVADSLILLDQTPTTGYPGAQIDKFSGQIVAKKTGEDDVILLESDVAVIGNPLQGTVRSLSENPATGFQVNQNELRYNYSFERSIGEDVATEYAYRVKYPFLYRWEYWEQQILATLPLDWFDSVEGFNGYNNEWFRIQALSGWNIYQRLETTATFNGVTKVINSDKLITPQDYLANGDWISEEMFSYDSGTPISFSGDPYIIENKRTTIVAEFEYNGGDSIDETDVYMVARIIPKEGGSYIANESLSSVYNREDNGILLGDSNGLIAITETTGVFSGTFFIDHTKLPKGILEYTISVSINRNSAPALADFGEVFTQDLKVLEVIDFTPPEIPKDPNPFKKCCYDLEVFADIVNPTDEFKNDFSAPLEIFPLQYAVTMKLEKLIDGVWTSQATLTNDTFGTYYALGFETKNNKNYVGYRIDWVKVLDDGASGFGAGKYRINFETSSGSLYSNEYCLEQFTLIRANNTVRFGYNWNSLIGDENQTKTRDFVGLDWDNQVRLRDAKFGDKSAAFELDDVRYQSGELRTVSKSFKEKYTLLLKKLPTEIFNLFLYDILLADRILISDYNASNYENYVEHSVEIEGGIEPNYSNSRPEISLTATFKSKYDNNIKYYS